MNDIRRPQSSQPPKPIPAPVVVPKPVQPHHSEPEPLPLSTKGVKPPRQQSRLIKWLSIVAVILLILFAIFEASAYIYTLPPTHVAQAFVLDLSKNQIDQAFALTSSHFQEQYPRSNFETTFSGASTIQNVTFNARQRHGTTATLNGKITLNSGDQVNALVSLTYENNTWKISAYTFGT